MKVSEFLQNEMPTFLLGAFYGRYEFSKDEKYIYTYSDYRNGAIYDNATLCEQSKAKYVLQLNKICAPYGFWKRKDSLISKANILFVLENDLSLSKPSFFNRLNTKIYSSDFIYDNEFTQEKKMFIRGFSELRASVDRNRNLLALVSQHTHAELYRKCLPTGTAGSGCLCVHDAAGLLYYVTCV